MVLCKRTNDLIRKIKLNLHRMLLVEKSSKKGSKQSKVSLDQGTGALAHLRSDILGRGFGS